MKKIFIILLFFIYPLCAGQDKDDTLQVWISKFHTINNLTSSPNGQLATFRKMYPNNIDTVLAIDLQKRKTVDTILQMSGQVFTKNNNLLSSGNGKAQINNFHQGIKKKYENIRIAEALFSLNQFLILDKQETLELIDDGGNPIRKIPNTQLFATDKSKALYACQKVGKQHHIINVLANQGKSLYTTDRTVKQMFLNAMGSQLILVESESNATLKVIFLDTLTGKITYPKGISAEIADHIDISEIMQGKAYLINFVTYNPPEKNRLVDIWYGTDNNLAAKQAGKATNNYYLWNSSKDHSVKLPGHYPIYSSIDSDRYVLAFNPMEEFQNITLHPYLNIFLYDTKNQSFQKIFHQIKKDIVHSKQGKYIIGLDPKEQKWLLYNVGLNSLSTIDKQGLRNPSFSKDLNTVYFESDAELWKYEIKSGRLFPQGFKKATEIIGVERKISNPQFGFRMNMLNTDSALLIKSVDKAKNLTDFSFLYKGKITRLISPTQNRIKEIKYNKNMEQFMTIEENHNMAPRIYLTNWKKDNREEIYRVQDPAATLLKQEIISFRNSIGIPLKGVLYYPKNFDASKRYPMVTYIYQIKSSAANVYSLPSNEATGVNRRTLLENGYLVYEPDIIFDSRGTGISALDCVHSALDALKNNPSINLSKVGLTGHSMGGYETNFIATQSNRFAAFISGAALSDMVSTYFSYDYAEQKPNHNRFETGQFEMEVPFSEDKDLYLKNSPVHHVENVKAPILLWNGMHDDVVVPTQAMEFFVGLKRNNLPVIALFYPNRGHDLGLNTRESKEMNKKALQWWNHFLKEKKNQTWIKL